MWGRSRATERAAKRLRGRGVVGSLAGVEALPLEVKAAIAVLLALTVAKAFFGPRSRAPDERLARMLVGLSVLLSVLAADALLGGQQGVAAAFGVFGVEALLLAAWVASRRDDDGGGGGGGPGDDPDLPPPVPIDWEAFDRARATWRPREPTA